MLPAVLVVSLLANVALLLFVLTRHGAVSEVGPPKPFRNGASDPARDVAPRLTGRDASPEACDVVSVPQAGSESEPPTQRVADIGMARELRLVVELLSSVGDEDVLNAVAGAISDRWSEYGEEQKAKVADELYSLICADDLSPAEAAALESVVVATARVVPPPSGDVLEALRSKSRSVDGPADAIALAWALRPRDGFHDPAWRSLVDSLAAAEASELESQARLMLRAADLSVDSATHDGLLRAALEEGGEPPWLLDEVVGQTPLPGRDAGLLTAWRESDEQERERLARSIADRGKGAVRGGRPLQESRGAFVEIYSGVKSEATRRSLLLASRTRLHLWDPDEPEAVGFIADLIRVEPDADDAQSLQNIAQLLERRDAEGAWAALLAHVGKP